MTADIELIAMEGPPDANSEANSNSSGASASFVSATDNATGQVTDTAAAGVDYLVRFRLRRHLMPHWRNVLEPSRVDLSGSILLLSFKHGEGVVSRQTLGSQDLGRPEAGASWVDSETPDGVSQAIFVRDISSRIIDTLGPAFNLSPETFEQHLVQSGYTESSYADPDPSTWPTRFLPTQHVSLRWFSPVLRKDMEPSDMVSRRRLLASGGLQWDRLISDQQGRMGGLVRKRRQQLHTATNIFRQEWPLSAVYRPPKRKLIPASGFGDPELVEIAEDDGSGIFGAGAPRGDDSSLGDPEIVAWEERITFCWGSRGQERCPIFFFDPLPHLCYRAFQEDTDQARVLPFSKRLAPRQPPFARLDSNPATLEGVYSYANSAEDACSDAAAWLDRLSRDATLQGCTPLDLQLLAVFHVVRLDTVVFLEHIDRVLDQITAGSRDERMMQEQLGYWRTLLGRFQSELPALDKSIRGFFMFPYQDLDGEPPQELMAALSKLQADTTARADKCESLQQALRADMSLLESKRGIEEAESVSRLTELAFLFIPITFAASLFSMQLQELVDNPPPVYAFVITAIVTVTASYGLRLVQRSTVGSSFLQKTAQQIRADRRVTTRDIPVRAILSWGAWKLGGKSLIIAVACSSLALIAAQLWTRSAMDVSFKAAVTGLALLSFLLTLLPLFITLRGGIPRGGGRSGNTFGFGRLWQAPAHASASRESRGEDSSEPQDPVSAGHV